MIVVAALLGLLLGVTYAHVLRWNIALYLRRERRGLATVVHVLRIAAAAGAIAVMARAGLAPVLAAALGFATSMLVRGRLEVR